MTHTAKTSPYFDPWIADVERSLAEARAAILARDFDRIAQLAEASCLRMHASALAADPGILYWKGATVELIHAVRAMRKRGTPAFFTIDAGPHVKVFCTPDSGDDRLRAWSDARGARCPDHAPWPGRTRHGAHPDPMNSLGLCDAS